MNLEKLGDAIVACGRVLEAEQHYMSEAQKLGDLLDGDELESSGMQLVRDLELAQTVLHSISNALVNRAKDALAESVKPAGS